MLTFCGRSLHYTNPSASNRAQSVPKRSGTTRLLVARRGTNGQVAGYTNCLTSPLASTDNAEADGSIPSSPTKGLIKGHFWSREYKHLNAEVDSGAQTEKLLVRAYLGLPVDHPRRRVVSTTCPKRAQGASRAERMNY